MFTPIRDLNLEIMSKMDDRTLLNVCATSKYGKELCQNENFWRNRLLEKYGDLALKLKPENISWKDQYMQIVIDTNRYFSPKAQILNRVIWDPRGEEYSTYVGISGNHFPFNKLVKQFLNAFYFMDLGPDFQHKTAFQYLQQKAKETNGPVVGRTLFLEYRLEKLAQ
jgi:c-di-AMP phosphodiesterase-like protein